MAEEVFRKTVLSFVMRFIPFISRSIFLTIVVTSTFWLIVLLVLINRHQVESKNTDTSQVVVDKSVIIKLEEENKLKIFEKDGIELYKGEPIKDYAASYQLKKGSEAPQIVLRNNFYNSESTEVYETDNPKIISIRSSFGDMGGWNGISAYINTDNNNSIVIEEGNGFFQHYQLNINDKINNLKHTVIQASIDDRCDDSQVHRAYLNDLLINGNPQKILVGSESLECIDQDELGDLVYLNYEGITKKLDKIFFELQISENNIKGYSYNLVDNQLKEENPNNLLKEYNGQFLTYDEKGEMYLDKNDGDKKY